MLILSIPRLSNHTKQCVRSVETSPVSTRTSSIPSLHELSDASEFCSEQSKTSLDSKLESPPHAMATEGPSFQQNLDAPCFSPSKRPGFKTSLPNLLISSEVQDEERVQFRVADVRKRLNDHYILQRKSSVEILRILLVSIIRMYIYIYHPESHAYSSIFLATET